MFPLKSFLGRLNRACVVLGSIFLASLAWANPPEGVLDETHAKVKGVMALQQEVTTDLMKLPDVLGTAVGLDAAGEPALVIYVDQDGKGTSEIVRALPPHLRGVALRPELTDKFRAFKGRPGSGGGGVSHTARQALPIQLGTSGGWRNRS